MLFVVDKGKEVVLILLDSAAFDTINHDVFLTRLAERYGIAASVICWFSTYFHNSMFLLMTHSQPHTLLEVVPQGSVIGPLSFTMYTAPSEDIIHAHDLCWQYSSIYCSWWWIERCVDDIKRWSTANDLKLNGDKTEVLHITYHFKKSSPLPYVQISYSIESVESACNLGVIVQNDLKMDLFVNNICHSTSFALYRIGQITKFLDKKYTEMLVHAFITCHLDQCNSLLYALPESQVTKLQRIQNSGARLVLSCKK